MDAAYAALGRTSADFWDRRAASFHRATSGTAEREPLYARLLEVIRPETVLLDVGAGTGRFALALAPRAGRVVAVEPNATMRSFLERAAVERGLRNVEVVPLRWEEVPDDLQADVVLCSHVLYPIEDVEPFLRKLDRATRACCFVTMRALHPDTLLSPIWERFHGEPRHAPPTAIAALDVLAEMGIFADVEVVGVPSTWRYASLDEAVEEHLESLILPDTPAVRAELRRLLAAFLVEREGALTLPVERLPTAIIRWGPAHRFAAFFAS